MILNYEQVKEKGIFTEAVEGNYNNAVYDIRVGKIITMKGGEVGSYKIPPQGMVVVVSTEQLTMPTNVVGYAHVRTSLSSKGIMAINIGILDPGYTGYLSSTLLNFGKEGFLIQKGDSFLRTTFHLLQSVEVEKPHKSKSLTPEHYMDKKRGEALKHMDEKFMSFDKEVSKAIGNAVKTFVGYASVISATIALFTYSYNILFPGPVKDYEKQLKTNQIDYSLLEREHRSLRVRMDSVIKSGIKLVPVYNPPISKPSSESK